MNGPTMVQSPQSKIKEIVDHVGLFQPSELCNHIGTFQVKEKMLFSPNNSQSTVPEISTTMDATVVFHHMLSNISNTLEVSKLTLLIHIPHKLENVSSEETLLLDMLILVASILPKETNKKWLKGFTMLDQFLSHLKLLMILLIIKVEYSVKKDVEQLIRMLIMLCQQLVMVLKMESNIGMLKIHGVLNGVFKGILKLLETKICVHWLNVTHIQ